MCYGLMQPLLPVTLFCFQSPALTGLNTSTVTADITPVILPPSQLWQQRLVDNAFSFQVAREVEITDAQTQDYINQHPDHQTIKSDVKSYYASKDHVILHQQLHHLLPNEEKLNRLLWNFMRRTVEFGGNYRNVEIGLPLGASLSPLFGALYLSPLDELAKNTPNTFYRRYMDDWVWVFPKKQHLRTTMKKQYGILQALRIAMHPAKTFIGKVKKGFDFLGFHLKPTGVTVSKAALSRHEQKVARLNEQNAKPKRIRAYRLQWLVWATLSIAALGQTANASTADTSGQCKVLAGNCYFPITPPGLESDNYCSHTGGSLISSGFAFGSLDNIDLLRFCYSSTPPTDPLTTTPCDVSMGETDNTTNYLILENTTLNTYCAYSYDIDISAPIPTNRRTNAAVYQVPVPTAVTHNIPVFGPFAVLAMIMGLVWFGYQRRT